MCSYNSLLSELAVSSSVQTPAGGRALPHAERAPAGAGALPLLILLSLAKSLPHRQGRGSLTLSLPDTQPGSSTSSLLSAGWSRAPRHSPMVPKPCSPAVPAPRKVGPWGAMPWQSGAPARFGDVTAALDLRGCAAASQALTQQQAAPSPTLGPGGKKSVAWPLRRGKFAEKMPQLRSYGCYPWQSPPGAREKPQTELRTTSLSWPRTAPAAHPATRILQACKGAALGTG